MSYQINDTGASLRFTSGDGFFFVMKHHIKAIRYVRDDMIKVDTGCCFDSLFIHASQVTIPDNTGANNLADILNGWTTQFLQGYPEPGPSD
ncbi:MAG: hypothetical protein BGO54_13790 [Sphingobacteriales bacterium 46-32]|nr:MAG: hypothetical protein BGO54_13790 [Sphingobacteriales bacterium 46-32]